MEKLKQYKYIILIILVILGFTFYWYEYRSTKIKERCFADAYLDATSRLDLSAFGVESRQGLINNYYSNCLMKFGLK